MPSRVLIYENVCFRVLGCDQAAMKRRSSSCFRDVSHRYYAASWKVTTILAQSVRDMSNHDPYEIATVASSNLWRVEHALQASEYGLTRIIVRACVESREGRTSTVHGFCSSR